MANVPIHMYFLFALVNCWGDVCGRPAFVSLFPSPKQEINQSLTDTRSINIISLQYAIKSKVGGSYPLIHLFFYGIKCDEFDVMILPEMIFPVMNLPRTVGFLHTVLIFNYSIDLITVQ